MNNLIHMENKRRLKMLKGLKKGWIRKEDKIALAVMATLLLIAFFR